MKNLIFDFGDYKKFLKAHFARQPKRGRGVQAKLAAEIGCQGAFVSQVISGPLHFSMEQAVRVNRFLGHTKDEGRFFVLLVQIARAGDKETRAHFQELLEAELKKQLLLTRRLDMSQGISAEDQVTYYSAWYYSAAHILATIPEFQRRQAIAEKLGLEKELVGEIVEFLVRTGLLVQVGDRLLPGTAQMHLSQSSKLTSRSHANLRIQALGALDAPLDTDVHYTGVYSFSSADAHRLKALLLRQIEEVIGVVKPSKEEQAGVFCVDFFSL